MRRSFLAVLVLSFTWGMTGCYTTHGVCDCEQNDPCAHRAPYVSSSMSTPATLPVTQIPPAAPLPSGR